MKPRKHKKLSTFYEDEDGDGDGAVGGRGGRDSAGGASQRAAKAAKRESFERGKAPARDPVELVDDEDEDAPDENDVNAVTMVRDRTPATRNPRRGARTVADPARPVAAARVPSFRDRAPDRLRLVTDPDRPLPPHPHASIAQTQQYQSQLDSYDTQAVVQKLSLEVRRAARPPPPSRRRTRDGRRLPLLRTGHPAPPPPRKAAEPATSPDPTTRHPRAVPSPENRFRRRKISSWRR